MPRSPRPSRAAAWRTTGRVATALLGGYALAAAVSALLARLAPVAPEQATAASLSLSFALYVAAILWALAHRNLGRVHRLIWGGAVACAVALRLLGRHP